MLLRSRVPQRSEVEEMALKGKANADDRGQGTWELCRCGDRLARSSGLKRCNLEFLGSTQACGCSGRHSRALSNQLMRSLAQATRLCNQP